MPRRTIPLLILGPIVASCAASPSGHLSKARLNRAVDAGATGVDGGVSAQGPRLVLVPQLTLDRWPDAWDPQGNFMARKAKGRCYLWQFEDGRYRGDVEAAVCDAWNRALGKSADGSRTVRFNGARAFVESSVGADGGPTGDRGDAAGSPTTAGSVELLGEKCAATLCPLFQSFAWRPQGDLLATTRTGQASVTVWNAASGKVVSTLAMNETPIAIAWNEDDKLLALTGERGGGPMYTWKGGEGTADVATDANVTQRMMDPYGRFVFVSKFDEGGGPEGGTGLTGNLEALVARHADGSHASWGEFPPEIASGPVASDEPPTPLSYDPALNRASKHVTTAFAWGADGSLITSVAALRDRSVTQQALLVWTGEEVGLQSLAYADLVKRLAGQVAIAQDHPYARVSADGLHVAFHETDRLEVRRTDRAGVELFWTGVKVAAFSPDEAVLAAEIDPAKVKIQDIATRSTLFEVPGASRLPPLPWSPDGSTLLTLDPAGVALWDTTAWKKKKRLEAQATETAGFSASGARIATLARGKGPQIWDAAAGTVAQTLEWPPKPTGSPWVRVLWPAAEGDPGRDGTTLYAVTLAGTVVIWDVSTGRVRQLDTALPSAWSLAPSGKLALFGGSWVLRTSDEAKLQVTGASVRTEEGAFDGDPFIVKNFVFRLGDDPLQGKMVNGEQAMMRLRAPGLTRDFIAGKPLSQPAGFGEPMSLDAPTVKVEPMATSDGWDFKVKVHDGGGGIGSVFLMQDGHPIAGGEGATRSLGGGDVERSVHVRAPVDGKRSVVFVAQACAKQAGLCSARTPVTPPLPKKK